jgi:hypothetical protein
MSTSPKFLLAAALVMLASAFPAPAGSEVRVHGATTVAYGLFTPEQRRIEKL